MKRETFILLFMLAGLTGCSQPYPYDPISIEQLPREGYATGAGSAAGPRSAQQKPPNVRSTAGAMRTVTGLVRRTNYGLVLDDAKSNRVFSIDNDHFVENYIGRNVKVIGHLTLEDSSIDVKSIEPIQ